MVPNSKIKLTNSPMTNKELPASTEIKLPLYGFKHNLQSVRIAASLETSYGDVGLNLTNYTLWGILHHSSIKYSKGRVNTEFLIPDYINQYNSRMLIDSDVSNEAWSFEAFVVAEADEIAQWHHDLEDALRGNAMTCSDVCSAIQRILKHIMLPEDISKLNDLKKRTRVTNKYVADLSRIVVNTLVNRIVECSLYNLNLLGTQYSLSSEKRTEFFSTHSWKEPDINAAIGCSKTGENDDTMKSIHTQFSNLISEKIHHSREVERMNAKGQYITKKLFQAYYSHPQQLPDGVIIQYMVDVGQYQTVENAIKVGNGSVRKKFESFVSNNTLFSIAAQIKLMRKICDHIAAMTDHYAIEEYENLYG